ncbi:MAG: hypothetical protein JWL81_1759 [Verrucomicrobiales bacterium]|nr:hypothetical protein [Verrucomicrobiales bacterium]
MKSPTSLLITSLALLTLTAAPAFSAIVVTLPTATVAGSLVITQDINFTITKAGFLQALVFDEWVTSDGAGNVIDGAAFTPRPLPYSLNGGLPTGVNFNFLLDNAAATSSDVTPNDGFILFNALSVALNHSFTVKAATYTIAAGSMPSGFNPQTQQTFTGNAFLGTGAGQRLSANTPVGAAVPEPGSLGLLALGGLAAATRRRRPPVG